MNFTFVATPPKHRAPRGSYDTLLVALQSRPGQWARVDPDTLGRSPQRQATAVLNASKCRGLRLQTTVRDGELYVRLRTDTLVVKPSSAPAMAAEQRLSRLSIFDDDDPEDPVRYPRQSEVQ